MLVEKVRFLSFRFVDVLNKMIILKKQILVPTEEGLYHKIYQIGKEKFNLVDPRATSDDAIAIAMTKGKTYPTDTNTAPYNLVWEDQLGVGYWTVSCREKADKKVLERNVKDSDRDYNFIRFRYWMQRFTQEILEQDPMKPFIERILSEAREVVELTEDRKTIEEALRGQVEFYEGRLTQEQAAIVARMRRY